MHPQLMKKLSKPSKVASILDWKKMFNNTVLTLNFHKNRVGIAVASHPSLGTPCMELEPLRFDDDNGNRKNISGSIDRDCLERFSDIIEEYKVCGVVVNWPLQHDTGRMGAACGRVIFALEQLWERSNENAMICEQRGGLLSRPFCLWDAGHVDLADPAKRVDSFGRCASYGKESEKPISRHNNDDDCSNSDELEDRFEKSYFASKEQYYEDELTVVLGVWDDFCREHWPELNESRSSSSVAAAIHEEDFPVTTTSSRVSDSLLRAKKHRPLHELPKTTKPKRSLVTMR